MAKPKKGKNGRWQITARYKDIITGKWTSKTRTLDTAAEARSWEASVIHESDLGHSEKAVTLGDYFPHWLEIFKAPFVEKRTITRVKTDMNHALKFFGTHKELNSINRATYQMWLNHEAENHSHETVRTMHVTFRSMMENAVEEGVIIRNPCLHVRFAGNPQPIRVPKQSVLNIHDYKLLLSEILRSTECASKYAAIVQAFTGMRIGEALGLTWDKIDWDSHTILIDGQWDYMEHTGRIHLKGHASPRKITVEASLMEYLKDYRKWQKSAQNARKVVSITSTNYLFAGEDGTPITPDAVNKFLRISCNHAGVTRITSHAWRRTQATLMKLAKMDDKFVASFLGHTVETLQKYYVRQTDDLIRENQKLRAEFLSSQGII
ncbi:tyrosine-type recombinase/integrase [Furfurilactobacillus siliginis]|nr:site-specific integrase [Furfurilactobacillus siliginis]GEK28478.1 site-specific integrase [Furfurilactobacillus siliginis]